jgi:hypothetical protein
MRLFKVLFLLALPFWTFSQAHFMGIPEEPDTLLQKLDSKVIMSTATYRNVGASYSLKQFAPTPKSQGEFGTCAAWATAYCARTIVESIANNETDKATITNNAFSPGFIYRLAAPDQMDCWGSFITNCLNQMSINGVPKLSEFMDPCPSQIPLGIYKIAQANTIKSYVKLWDDQTYFQPLVSPKMKVQMLKKSISENCPVVLAIFCPNSFHTYRGGEWQPTEEVGDKVNHAHGRHAICAVGYDDEKYGGAVEIQNSWGDSWGNQGYAWINYDDFAKFAYQAVEVIGNPVNALQSDFTVTGGIKLLRSDGTAPNARQNSDGSFSISESLRSGERFRLFLNSSQASYVYLLNISPKNQWTLLFPFDNVSAYLNYNYSEVPIPSEDKFMRLNGETGTERLIVLYSQSPINTVDFLKKISIEPPSKTIEQKLKNVLGTGFISLPKIEAKEKALENKMQYRVSVKKNQILGAIISFEHID